MRKGRIITAVAMLATTLALAVTAGASAQTASTYRVAGIEIRATPATFVGSLVGQAGVWRAVVEHATLDSTPGGTTTITGGSFTIKLLGRPALGGSISSGELTAGPISGGLLCVQKFSLNGTGTLDDGSFDGALVHYGVRSGGGCNAFAASFTGSVTIGS